MENQNQGIDRDKLTRDLVTAAGHLVAGMLSYLNPEKAEAVHRQLEDGSRYIQVGIRFPGPCESGIVTVALAHDGAKPIPLGAVVIPPASEGPVN